MINSTIALENIEKICKKYEEKAKLIVNKKKTSDINFKTICNNVIILYNESIDVSLNILVLIDKIKSDIKRENIESIIEILSKLKDTFLYVSNFFSQTMLSFLSRTKHAFHSLSRDIVSSNKTKIDTSYLMSFISKMSNSEDIESKNFSDTSRKLIQCCEFILGVNEEMNKIYELKDEEHVLEDEILLRDIVMDAYNSLSQLVSKNKKVKNSFC